MEHMLRMIHVYNLAWQINSLTSCKDHISTKLKKIDISLYGEIEFIKKIIGYQMGSHCFSHLVTVIPQMTLTTNDDLQLQWHSIIPNQI